MFVGLGLESRLCYQVDGLDVVGLGFSYVLLGEPIFFHFSTIFILFILPSEGISLRQGLQEIFVYREQAWSLVLMPPFHSVLEKVIHKKCSGVIS